MKYDYLYLCNGLGHLTGLEVRAYKNDKLFMRYSPLKFNPDIFKLVSDEVKSKDQNAFYIETDEQLIFGVVKSKKDKMTVVIGPTSQIRPSEQDAVKILYSLSEPITRLKDIQTYFANMIPYPFENFLEILCFVNYALNDEKVSVTDLITDSNTTFNEVSNSWVEQDLDNEIHNTFEMEKNMLSLVKSGNVEAINEFFKTPPTGRSGELAQSELRQRRNTFICAATIISRAAIEGGLSANSAFALSDRYIQKVEMLNTSSDIATLNMEMLLDYTKKVEAIKCGVENSSIAKKVARYTQRNLSNKISISELSNELKINRTYLCEKFKEDTGKTINEFITLIKLDEAKRMLEISELSISEISEYLAFSSQSYFQNLFKKYENCTPKEYRNKS